MGGGGGGAVGLRLNIMTALYLPILGYAMATFDLSADALVLSGDNLKPHVVAESQQVAVGDQYEASIMFTLKNEHHSDGGHGSAIFKPEIELNYDKTPEGLQWDAAEQRLVMDTGKLFENESSDTYTKEVDFAGLILGKTAKDIQQDRPASYREEIEGSFTVFRPTIQVQSNAVPKLYADSRNSLSFTVPGVSATTLSLKEKFSGQTFSGNSLTFSPTGDTTVIEVFRGAGEGSSNKLGEKGFKITKPPTPIVGLRQEGDQDFFTAEDRVDLFTPFELVIRADETFASEYPQDAKYRVDEMKVEVTRTGLAPLSKTFSRSDLRDNLDLSREGEGEFIYNVDLFEVSNNPSGSGISVFITGLSRINYQNKRIPVNLENVPSQFTYKSQ
jgi:hypothetical protein